MKIVSPQIDVYPHYPVQWYNSAGSFSQNKFLEKVGRTCYQSEDKITQNSADLFVTKLNELGHHAMLEHCVISVCFICDRGITHEMVRHRLASFAQESTRYTLYTKDKFDGQISVIKPPFKDKTGAASRVWEEASKKAEEAYQTLIALGESPQIARSVLPTCLKSEIWITANLREWMHIFNLRCSPKAHPQIREVMLEALNVFADITPSVFLPIKKKFFQSSSSSSEETSGTQSLEKE